jgi:hypothetical protein
MREERSRSRSISRFPCGTMNFGIVTESLMAEVQGEQRRGKGGRNARTLLTGRVVAAREEAWPEEPVPQPLRRSLSLRNTRFWNHD